MAIGGHQKTARSCKDYCALCWALDFRKFSNASEVVCGYTKKTITNIKCLCRQVERHTLAHIVWFVSQWYYWSFYIYA